VKAFQGGVQAPIWGGWDTGPIVFNFFNSRPFVDESLAVCASLLEHQTVCCIRFACTHVKLWQSSAKTEFHFNRLYPE